jgi:hypothetical protein
MRSTAMSLPTSFRLVWLENLFSLISLIFVFKDLENVLENVDGGSDFNPFSASSTEDSFPHLPAELERDIFELAIKIHRKSAFQLVLVAKRVQIWYSTSLNSDGPSELCVVGSKKFFTKSLY